MRKYIKFTGSGRQHELSPLTYDEFMSLDIWGSASDMGFDQWLRHNKLREIDSFNDEAISDSVIVVDIAPRDYEYNPSGDEETWVKLEFPFVGSQPPGGGMSGAVKRRVGEILKEKYGDDNPAIKRMFP